MEHTVSFSEEELRDLALALYLQTNHSKDRLVSVKDAGHRQTLTDKIRRFSALRAKISMELG